MSTWIAQTCHLPGCVGGWVWQGHLILASPLNTRISLFSAILQFLSHRCKMLASLKRYKEKYIIIKNMTPHPQMCNTYFPLKNILEHNLCKLYILSYRSKTLGIACIGGKKKVEPEQSQEVMIQSSCGLLCFLHI